MSTMTPTICVLEPARDANPNDADADKLLLSLAAQRLADLCGFAHAQSALLHENLDARLLDEEPLILLVPMPRSLALGEKIQDFVLGNDDLAFLLAHPSCFVVLITGLDRPYLDGELAAWSKRAGLSTDTHEHLASATPLFWSFMTLSELTADAPPAGLREILTNCARRALLDPTGLRSLLVALLKGAAMDVAARGGEAIAASNALLFAIVADDEEDVAVTHGHHLRRLGYSTLVVHDADMWKQIIPGGAWSERARSDVLMFDDYMDFQPGEPRIGHAMLDELPAKLKIYVTGLASADGNATRRNIVSKPITDAHDLRQKLDRASVARLADRLSDARAVNESIHLAPATVLRRTARHVASVATRIDERRNRRLDAALHHLEAYHLFNGVDESGAANAFVRFQLLEVGVVAGQHPDALDSRFWPDREREIRRVLSATFGAHKTEGLWWVARIFQEIEVVMDASLVAADLLLQVDASTTRAVMRLQWRQERPRRKSGVMRYLLWLRWLNPLLWVKWGLRISFAAFNSFGRVLATWVVCNLAFAVVYAWLGTRCDSWKGIELLWPARAIIASFGAGTGLAFPQDYGLCLPADGHLWFGSAQRILTLVFIAKLLDLFVTRTRTRA